MKSYYNCNIYSHQHQMLLIRNELTIKHDYRIRRNKLEYYNWVLNKHQWWFVVANSRPNVFIGVESQSGLLSKTDRVLGLPWKPPMLLPGLRNHHPFKSLRGGRYYQISYIKWANPAQSSLYGPDDVNRAVSGWIVSKEKVYFVMWMCRSNDSYKSYRWNLFIW